MEKCSAANHDDMSSDTFDTFVRADDKFDNWFCTISKQEKCIDIGEGQKKQNILEMNPKKGVGGQPKTYFLCFLRRAIVT